jgi:hypothetical protein
MVKNFITQITILLFLSCPVFGTVKDSTLLKLYNRSSAGIRVSTFGYGINLHSSLSQKSKFGFGLDYTFLRIDKNRTLTFSEKSSIDILPDVKHSMISAYTTYYPWKKTRFGGKAGIGYNFGQKYEAVITSTTGVELGGVEISGEDFGVVDVGIKWNKLMPYLGITYLKPMKKSRVLFGFDVGCLYMGSPVIRSEYEGFLESTTLDTDIKKIQHNMKNYSFYPYLSFHFNYSLFKDTRPKKP